MNSINVNYHKKLNRLESFNFKLGIKKIFSNYIFILFSFINLFLPFYATIIAASFGNNGIYNLVSVGLTTSFITIFNQFLFLISISIIFVYKKQNFKFSNSYNVNYAYLFLLIISIICIGLFLLTSFIYTKFSTSYQNFEISSIYELKFILSLCPTILFNAFIYYFIISKYYDKNRKTSVITLLLFFVLNIIFIPIFYYYLPLNSQNYIIGIGIGFTFSSLLIFLFILVYRFIFDHFYLVISFSWLEFFKFNKKIIHFSVNFLLSTFMKIFLIMAISLALGLSQKDTPPELMIAKIVWYNSLFFCGWFADGLLYSIEYTRLINYKNNKTYSNNKEIWNFLVVLSAIITLLICIVFNFVVIGKITTLYTSHQTPVIVNPLPNWPYQLDGEAINNYLWSPNGSYNFKLVSIVNNQVVYAQSSHFAIMYTTIFHVLINSTKIMSIKKLNIPQKFDLKSTIINFITIALIMIFIVVFSVVPDTYSFNKTFGGIDAFSFSLMVVSILMFSATLLGYIKQKNMK